MDQHFTALLNDRIDKLRTFLKMLLQISIRRIIFLYMKVLELHRKLGIQACSNRQNVCDPVFIKDELVLACHKVTQVNVVSYLVQMLYP